jgi:uncharacterized protein YdeI (YjbR/CyaY-like superfamily)
MNPMVDSYLKKAANWREEMEQLRKIMLDCQLSEELKWGKPCYAFENKNIAIIQPFKDHCALLFFKGALLKDPDKILVKTGPNTQAGRQVRFKNPREIMKLKKILKAYVYEAIEAEETGAKVHIEKHPTPIPAELQTRLDKDRDLRSAFESLTPGRQRAYIFYFSAPKQSKTRESRIEKYTQHILDGKGLND